MSTTLFVRLPHRPHDQPQPWRFGAMPFALVRDAVAAQGRRERAPAAGHLLREGQAPIAELPAADRLVLIVAAADVLVTTAAVPPLAPNRLKLALPNLVEDSLAADAQACHIAVGPEAPQAAADASSAAAAARGPRRRLLMVTERAWLRAVLDAFAEHRHRRRHLLAAQFCLPLLPAADQAAAAHASSPAGPAAAPEPAAPSQPSEPPATLALEAASSALAAAAPLLDGEADTGQAAPVWQLTVRTDRYQGYGLLLGDDALAAWQALAPAGVWYGDRKAAALPTLNSVRPLGWPVWIEGAQAALRESALDLAQFDFAQGRADRWNLRAWRAPLALAAALLLVHLAALNIHWLMLRGEQARLQQAQTQLLRSAFPRMPVVVDPPLQMRRQVEQLRLASGRSTPDDFLPLADRFAQAGRQLPPDALLALEYRGKTLHATLKPGTDTNALRQAARQAGLSMEEDRAPAEPARSGGGPAPAGSRWIIKPGALS
ncbi:type II secretion system protein GspL [Cupriavidus gilardii]|uniref:type II secretion system protein GspL n=1 Tax=Cupriavidus gilardii TaxID=82541 RepID=UPI0015809A11|nr:type II secretion system protein GspL [Cupriavidus gilardii]MCT9074360.1 type II secretion system protein GspL [Cupriavidus gilardii]QKS64697.1 general secretion pathway protein GspL [Cupriavidus gilardii]